MASGILGQSALSATTNTTVYTVPSSTLGIVNISIVNKSTSANAAVRLALAAGATPTSAEWIEYDTIVPPRGVIERTAIALNAAKRVVVYASTADVSVSVYGIESAA